MEPSHSFGSLMGLSHESWQVIAAFWGPVAAALVVAGIGVVLGSWRLRRELEGQDVRRQFLEEGVLKLSNDLEQLLGATRLNYNTSLYLLRHQRDVSPHNSIAPRPEDMPELIPSVKDPALFAGIGPASELTNYADMGKLCTRAIADLVNFNAWIEMDFFVSIRASYSPGRGGKPLPEGAFEVMAKEATRRYHLAERSGALPGILRRAGIRAMELHFHSFGDLGRIHRDPEILSVKKDLEELLKVIGATEEPEPIPHPPPQTL